MAAVTGGDVCALNLQSQLMGKIEGFGMRCVVSCSPAGGDAAVEMLPARSGMVKREVGDTFLPYPRAGGQVSLTPGSPAGSRLLLGWPVTIGGSSWGCRQEGPHCMWRGALPASPTRGCAEQAHRAAVPKCQEAPEGLRAQSSP